MRKSISKTTILILISFICGCAASSSGGKISLISYSTNVGVATTFDFKDKTERILNKYQFQIERYEEYGDRLYIETKWKDRIPFEDEKKDGIIAARSRLIVKARPRTRTGITVKLNQIQFIGENLVLFANRESWRPAPLTKMCKAYFKQCADDLKTEFRTGIRRYDY